MAGFPRIEFPSQILAARFTQLGDDLGILRCQPVLQFIERFDRRKYWHWNFDGVLRHSRSVSVCAPKATASPAVNGESKLLVGHVVLSYRSDFNH
jgi:hypothetical protein